MSDEVALEVAPHFEHLAMVRSVLSSTLEAEPVLKHERVQDLRLAVSEAMTNAIEAHQRVDSDASVGIRIRVGDEKVVVEISDHGGGFDPSQLTKHPPVTDPERLEFERGLGVTLMRRLTDDCEITSTETGTTVTLVVHR